MKYIIISFLSGLLAVLATTTWAAQAPLSADELKKEATNIVHGTIVEVTATTQKATVDKGLFNRDRIFKMKLKVARVSKGSEVKGGEEITIVAWRAHRRLPWHAGPHGHGPIPKKTEKVTVYLKYKAGSAYRPILPNGIVIEKKTD
ncbi:MAG: hypothetical protein HN742_42645 [Lentisphaerae bacterium]|jgi:hypothetical protein|nr:hypothetical protein [Lentisphaerota bacterium]MBT4820998.1 hypothetical protein [Lentisphaerota bacterium]MBT7055009.1 hypothetical protein [Lentisphaerota bacterium]MBT7848638.1 hypothetical protein [Lentisphaerota bacterium]